MCVTRGVPQLAVGQGAWCASCKGCPSVTRQLACVPFIPRETEGSHSLFNSLTFLFPFSLFYFHFLHYTTLIFHFTLFCFFLFFFLLHIMDPFSFMYIFVSSHLLFIRLYILIKNRRYRIAPYLIDFNKN